MKEKEILNLNGLEFSLQRWVKTNNISKVKYSENRDKKSGKTKIYRSPKHYSLLY